MGGVPTNAMPSISEEAQRSRWARAAATLRAAGVCGCMLRCSSTQWVSIAFSSRLACSRRSRAARPTGLSPRAARLEAEASYNLTAARRVERSARIDAAETRQGLPGSRIRGLRGGSISRIGVVQIRAIEHVKELRPNGKVHLLPNAEDAAEAQLL